MKTRLERGKNMKNKKGFTLIELLAVIVILAIIALIAVPVVMNIISRANKSAFKDSAYGVLKAGENYYMGELLKAEAMTEDKMFDFSNDTVGLEINGSKPTGGSMIVRTDGKIAMAIHNGRHCVTKGFEDEDVTITDDVENCKNPAIVTLFDLATTGIFEFTHGTSPVEVPTVDECATSGICEAGTPFAIKVNKTETYKFYVLNDDGKEITLIMDRNLYSTEDLANGTHNVAWYKDSDDTTNNETNVQGPLTALSVLKTRTSGWTNIPAYSYTLENDDDSQEIEYTYPDITGELVTNVRARLPRLEELTATNVGCTMSSCPPWLLLNYDQTGDNNTFGYWISTAVSSHLYSAWNIDSYGCPFKFNVNYATIYGIRPVITLLK